MSYPSDPYASELTDMADSKKLYVLADWFDVRDNERDYVGRREVQDDLRRIAEKLELDEIAPLGTI